MIAASRYYSGPVTQCDYEIQDNKGRKRRIQIALGNIEGKTVAVRASVKISLLPDPVFQLLMPVSKGADS